MNKVSPNLAAVGGEIALRRVLLGQGQESLLRSNSKKEFYEDAKSKKIDSKDRNFCAIPGNVLSC